MFGSAAFARDLSPRAGLVEIRPGYDLYVEHRPARRGKPTLFLANGLTYTTRQWRRFADAMTRLDPDVGLVLYDMHGMGRTLLADGPATQAIPFASQARDLRDLRRALSIRGSAAVLGLSYGGGVVLKTAAEYPDAFDQFIAMSPFLEPFPDSDHQLKRAVATHRLMFPLDPRSDRELYDFYLRGAIYSTFPVAEPSVLENPYQLEAIFRLVQGAEDWSAGRLIPRYPHDRLHLVAARDDEYVKFDRVTKFLEAVPAGLLQSVLVIEKSHHKLPEERPELSAAWVHQILTGNPDLQRGLIFSADPARDEARSGDLVIPLHTDFCESEFRPRKGMP
jgi:pimeloyl-ACP methyl ester carboxylesterase